MVETRMRANRERTVSLKFNITVKFRSLERILNPKLLLTYRIVDGNSAVTLDYHYLI